MDLISDVPIYFEYTYALTLEELQMLKKLSYE